MRLKGQDLQQNDKGKHVPTATTAIVDSLPESGYSQVMTVADEQLLLERIRAGDDSGFEQLVREHTGKVIGLAWRLVGSKEEAEDPGSFSAAAPIPAGLSRRQPDQHLAVPHHDPPGDRSPASGAHQAQAVFLAPGH